jgi:hypothetical protein
MRIPSRPVDIAYCRGRQRAELAIREMELARCRPGYLDRVKFSDVPYSEPYMIQAWFNGFDAHLKDRYRTIESISWVKEGF